VINGVEDRKENLNGKRVKLINSVEDGRDKTSGTFVPITTMHGVKNQPTLNSEDYNKANLLKSFSCVLWHQLLHFSIAHMYHFNYLESSITVS